LGIRRGENKNYKSYSSVRYIQKLNVLKFKMSWPFY
jgi:hypothetical protein